MQKGIKKKNEYTKRKKWGDKERKGETEIYIAY
jgi:hypothetical protein